MIQRNILSTTIILVVSILFFTQTYSIPETAVTMVSSAMFPRIILGVIIAMAVVQLYGDIRKRPLTSVKREPVHVSLLVVFVLLAVLLGLLEWAGFVVAATVFMTLFSLFMTGHWNKPLSVLKTLAINLLLSFGIYYLFVNVLMFVLP